MTSTEKIVFTAKLGDLEVLWLTLFGEFRGEPVEAQIAGGNVIINRLVLNHKSLKDVCLAEKQFSCWNIDDPNLDRLQESYQNPRTFDRAIIAQLKHIANGLISGSFLDNSKGATHYLTTALLMSTKAPSWAAKMKSVYVSGKTSFLKE